MELSVKTKLGSRFETKYVSLIKIFFFYSDIRYIIAEILTKDRLFVFAMKRQKLWGKKDLRKKKEKCYFF